MLSDQWQITVPIFESKPLGLCAKIVFNITQFSDSVACHDWHKLCAATKAWNSFHHVVRPFVRSFVCLFFFFSICASKTHIFCTSERCALCAFVHSPPMHNAFRSWIILMMPFEFHFIRFLFSRSLLLLVLPSVWLHTMIFHCLKLSQMRPMSRRRRWTIRIHLRLLFFYFLFAVFPALALAHFMAKQLKLGIKAHMRKVLNYIGHAAFNATRVLCTSPEHNEKMRLRCAHRFNHRRAITVRSCGTTEQKVK